MQEEVVELSPSRIKLRFGDTYYLVYLIDSFISRKDIITRAFSDHFTDSVEDYAAPFQRWTALHLFIEFFIEQVFAEDFVRASEIRYIPKGACSSMYCNAEAAYLHAIDLMKLHGLQLPDLAKELDDWVESGCPSCPEPSSERTGPDFDMWEPCLDGEYAKLMEQLAEETFFVLFANRTFLHRFHSHMASWIGATDAHDWLSESKLFCRRRNGDTGLRRARIPEWAKRAVFFRDRGRCCACGRDLGAGYSPANNAEYDHIVPLAAGGLNDVTNLQLLCKKCNSQKSHLARSPSQVYDRWYPVNYRSQPRSYPTLERVVLSLERRDPG